MRVQHMKAHLCALAALLLAAAAAAQDPVLPVRPTGATPIAASQGATAAALAPPADAQAAALATYPPIHSDATSQPRAVAFAPGDGQAREIASFEHITRWPGQFTGAVPSVQALQSALQVLASADAGQVDSSNVLVDTTYAALAPAPQP